MNLSIPFIRKYTVNFCHTCRLSTLYLIWVRIFLKKYEYGKYQKNPSCFVKRKDFVCLDDGQLEQSCRLLWRNARDRYYNRGKYYFARCVAFRRDSFRF